MKNLVAEGALIVLAIFIASMITGKSTSTGSLQTTTGDIMKNQVSYLKRTP